MLKFYVIWCMLLLLVAAQNNPKCSGKSNKFSCKGEGRFDDPNDPTCTRYFTCLKSINGSFIPINQECNNGLLYDSTRNQCVLNYTCPCYSNADVTEEPAIIPQCAGTEKANFTCSTQGRFRKPNDYTCTKYYFCYRLRNGHFVQREYRCPSGSYFNPPYQLCSLSHICICDIITTTHRTTFSSNTTTALTTVSTLTYPLSTPIISSSSESTTISSTTLGSTIPYTTETQTTADKTTTETDTSKHNYICETSQNNSKFVCPGKGRFINRYNSNCSDYYLCIKLYNGSFVEKLFDCPSSSLFDPKISSCSTTYTCPCLTTLSTSTQNMDSSTTTSTSTTTKVTTETPLPNYDCDTPSNILDFVCTTEGRFINRYSPNCSNYYLCVKLHNGTFVSKLYDCPTFSCFDPTISLCSSSYRCPCWKNETSTVLPTSSVTSQSIISTTPISTTTTTTKTTATQSIVTTTPLTETTTATLIPDGYDCDTPSNILDFVCTTEGRFINRHSPNCSNYYLCVKLHNGTFVSKLYDCPPSSCFDPKISLCSTIYKCPCLKYTTISPLTTFTTSRYSNTTATTTEITETTTATTELNKTTSTLITTPDKPPTNVEPFVCSKSGRFRNPLDVKCKSYYLCVRLRNGSFVQEMYYCPGVSKFHPTISICSLKYQCPCNN